MKSWSWEGVGNSSIVVLYVQRRNTLLEAHCIYDTPKQHNLELHQVIIVELFFFLCNVLLSNNSYLCNQLGRCAILCNEWNICGTSALLRSRMFNHVPSYTQIACPKGRDIQDFTLF
jgi:hypothetical protein